MNADERRYFWSDKSQLTTQDIHMPFDKLRANGEYFFSSANSSHRQTSIPQNICVHLRLLRKPASPCMGWQRSSANGMPFEIPTPVSAVPNAFSTLSRQGFTLIEVMIVVVILGILAAVVVPKILDRPDQARITAAKADIAIIMQALKIYRLDNGSYPSTDQGLQALVQKPATNPLPANWKQGGYLERLPSDPWKTPYQYLNPGIKGEIDVYSLGADGQPGGEGNNADIGSWAL